MLKLTAIEFVLRAIPEGLIFMLSSYSLSKYKINVKRYITSSLLFSLSVYLIRMLPINYGVHTILSIIIQTYIIISINKIEIIGAIKASIISVMCLFFLEMVNVLVLNIIFKNQLDEIMLNLNVKILFGLPSLICYATIIINYYNYLRKKDKLRNV